MSNLCIGPTSTGSGDGSDWNNVLQWSTFTPVRGNAYYLKNGSYGGKTLSTATSSTTRISILKATIADHGPATGWSDAYEAPATFSAKIVCLNGYWTFDGKYGVAGLLGATTAFGFQITTGDVGFPNGTCIEIGGGTAATNVNNIVRYVDAYGQPSLGDYFYTNSLTCIYTGKSTDAIVEYCYLHGADNLVNTQTGGSGSITSINTTVRYCVLQASRSSNPSFHSNVVFWTAASGTFYGNLVFNYNDEGFFVTGAEYPPTSTVIYNNVFWSGGGTGTVVFPRAVELRQDFSYTDILIYGNTIVDMTGLSNVATSVTGCEFTNNLLYGGTNTLGTISDTTNTIAGSSSIFVNYAAGDFHLTSNTANGTTLSSPYNVDKDGNPRPSGGIWDRGAYQYVAGTISQVIKRLGRYLRLHGPSS